MSINPKKCYNCKYQKQCLWGQSFEALIRTCGKIPKNQCPAVGGKLTKLS